MDRGKSVVGNDEHGRPVSGPGSVQGVQDATDEGVGQSSRRVARGRPGAERVMRAVQVEQVEYQQTRLALTDNLASGLGPDLVADDSSSFGEPLQEPLGVQVVLE